MTDWQPIATAPKDGTRILAYGVIALESSPSIATVIWQNTHWIADPNEASEYLPEACELTHWMPLPEPPKEAGDTIEELRNVVQEARKRIRELEEGYRFLYGYAPRVACGWIEAKAEDLSIDLSIETENK